MSKTERGDREEAPVFEVGTGMAFLSGLISEYSPTVLPFDLNGPICQSVSICQNTAGSGRLSLQHIVTALEICGVEVHTRKTSEAHPICRYGCSKGSWARDVLIQPCVFLKCLHRPPVLTPTYTELPKAKYTPMHIYEEMYGLSLINPGYKDIGSMTLLPRLLAEQTGSWMEDAALVRALLIADACVAPHHLAADPIWAKVACDGDVASIEQEPMVVDPGPFNDVSISICAVPLDTWVSMHTGCPQLPEGWELNFWNGGNIAVVPIESSFLQNQAVWLYILSFVTTQLWNGLHLYRAIIKPNKELCSASPNTEHIVVKFKPLATNVVVGGASRILLVLADQTSRLDLREVHVTDIKIPIWRPSEEAVSPVDVTEILRRKAGTRGAADDVRSLWPIAWQYLMRYTATEASVQRAIYLVAETTRNLDLGFASNPAKAFPVYSIHLKSDFLPNLPDVNFDVKKWEDPNMNIQDAITNINIHNVYPHGFHPGAWISFKLTDGGTKDILTLLNFCGAGAGCNCHEASPDVLVARFVGLIAPGTAVEFSNLTAVHENVSAVAAFQCIGTAWMQSVAGVSWITWALNDEQDGYEMCNIVVNKMVNEATFRHIVRIGPDPDWASYVISCFGIDNLTSSTLVSWWALKYVVQKMNYMIPAYIECRKMLVGTEDRVGLFFTKASEWQALQRMSSRIAVREASEVPSYASTGSESPEMKF
ncbi:unnamed protein product [Gongylonema pulchrum]|uniref:C2 domain-containing protein n=1 Tax=Gongylonema pulchrum TaxID=637853 RepID=A0A183CZV4_9BILA|nr:unnamed protein product [Gongylonema pulchrum]